MTNLLDRFHRVWSENAFGVFLTGFGVSLVLPLILGFVVAILFRHPKAFGIVHLFWRPRKARQFSIGLGLGAVVWQVFLAGYLFEPMATNFTQDRAPFCEIQPPIRAADGYRKGEFDGGRMRYDPAHAFTVVRYSAAVLCGTSLWMLAFAAGIGVWYVVFHSWRRPAGPVAVRTAPPAPIPRSPLLPLGILCGYLGTAALAATMLHHPEGNRLAAECGESLVQTAGWGKGAARGEYVAKVAAGTLAPDERTITAEQYYHRNFESRYSNRMRPYFPVFGAYFLTGALVSVFYLGWFVVPRLRRNFCPASGISFLVHLLLLAHTYFSYFVAAPGLIQFVALLLMLGSGVVYKLRFAKLDYSKPLDLVSHYRKRARTALRSPMLAASDLGPGTGVGKRPVALVCVSGGGSRAAAWTMKVLTELEEAFEREGIAFPYHVRLVSGASGGMIAAGYYVGGLLPPAPGGAGVNRASTVPTPRPEYPIRRLIDPKQAGMAAYDPLVAMPAADLALLTDRQRLNNNIRQDFLTPVANAIVMPDLPSLLVPGYFWHDRGRAIEAAWESYLHGTMRATFAGLHAGERAGWRPSLVFSPMLVEDGRQLFISNLDFTNVLENRAPDLRGAPPFDNPDNLLSREGLEFFKLFPEAHESFQLGTAARMSASFPYVMPAAELPTNPPRKVVDAGYYDNFGVGIASAWLFNNIDWVRAHASKVVVVQIRDGVSEGERRRETVSDTLPYVPRRGLDWLLSPPVGLYNFRTAATSFRNDNLLDLLARFFRAEKFPEDFFRTATFEFAGGDDVALSFALTADECRRIDTAAETDPRVRGRIDALVRWWK